MRGGRYQNPFMTLSTPYLADYGILLYQGHAGLLASREGMGQFVLVGCRDYIRRFGS